MWQELHLRTVPGRGVQLPRPEPEDGKLCAGCEWSVCEVGVSGRGVCVCVCEHCLEHPAQEGSKEMALKAKALEVGAQWGQTHR